MDCCACTFPDRRQSILFALCLDFRSRISAVFVLNNKQTNVLVFIDDGRTSPNEYLLIFDLIVLSYMFGVSQLTGGVARHAYISRTILFIVAVVRWQNIGG